ncbi:MAG TPA: hypothetical protein VLX56_04085 [Nitrososphaerales archaeon]|nr:hypothetical protein [Nitrososphaerales archaeon]
MALLAALLASSSAPPGASARTIGIQANDTFVYSYEVYTTYATPNGNQTSTQYNQFSVSVLWTNTTRPLGEVAYSEAITEVNGTTVTSPSALQNTTTIFDPYNNDTYLGNIGFYPFAYTDLAPGTADDLNVSLTVLGTPAGALTGPQLVNATVARGAGEVLVNFTIFASAGTPPSQNVLRYNSTTGVLTQGTTYTHFFDVEKNFIYTLVSSSHVPSGIFNPNAEFLVASAAVVVVGIIAVWRVTSATEKGKFAKARRKMKR